MPNTPHDRFARRAFADLEVARAHFRAFLPRALVERIDLARLRREADVHVDERMRERRSDLLFSTPVHGGDAPLLVHLLFEHKSTPDRWLPHDLSRSAVRIHEGWRGRHRRARELPWIVPVVLYAGARPFRTPRRLSALCGPRDLADAAAPFAPEIGYHLTDLSAIDDDLLRARVGDAAFAALAHLALKHARADDLFDRIVRWADLVRALLRSPTGLAAIEALLSYGFEVSGEDAGERFDEKLAPVLDAPERETMRTTMRTFAEARREEGREVGRRHEAADNLLRLMQRRFGDVPHDVAARIEAAPLDDLHRWLDRLLDAGRLEDVVS